MFGRGGFAGARCGLAPGGTAGSGTPADGWVSGNFSARCSKESLPAGGVRFSPDGSIRDGATVSIPGAFATGNAAGGGSVTAGGGPALSGAPVDPTDAEEFVNTRTIEKITMPAMAPMVR